MILAFFYGNAHTIVQLCGKTPQANLLQNNPPKKENYRGMRWDKVTTRLGTQKRQTKQWNQLENITYNWEVRLQWMFSKSVYFYAVADLAV